MNDFLDTPIEYLKGVGPQRADALKKELQIFTFIDLVQHYPFRYVDRTKFYAVNEINPDLPHVQLKGKIVRHEIVGKHRAKRLIAYLKDETGTIELVWFQGIKWIEKKINYKTEYVVFGKAALYGSKLNITHPELEEVSEENTKFASALQAVYPATEKLKSKGLDSKGIGRLIKTLFKQIEDERKSQELLFPENLSNDILTSLKFISRYKAIKNIHLPESPEMLTNSEYRLKFEELFFLQLKLISQNLYKKNNYRGFVFEKVGKLFNEFYSSHLPFQLTAAQKKVIKEIRSDLGSGKQMNRLLQGDVGSGKTIVALMLALLAIDNGYQTCIMAPTEILANQHYKSICDLLKNLPVNIRLLTGSTKKAERKSIHEQLENGSLHIIVGTHALTEDNVKFNNLGLAVIDEQHRFGVEQRSKLWKKNSNPPHILVMTATPIPRTLAMTLYGDLDVSVIDELPPGRKEIQTVHRYDSQRLRVFQFLKEEIAKGRQVYIVYPLIEESEKLDLKNLMDGFDAISQSFPKPDYQLSIVHGQMKTDAKDFEMKRFLKNETQIMVATTVIEVGVNIPNASVMLIENAERFGLSQLHQLRGRVGRGAEQSYCILMTSNKISAEAKIRIETMCRTSDGFEISEVDLKLRGPGDMAGTQQSGLITFKLADLTKDGKLLSLSRNIAIEILNEDPQLEKEKNAPVKNYYKRSFNKQSNWTRIS